MGILYILNYVDRSALAATKVYGIMDDLNMDETQFATAISILFGRSSHTHKLVLEGEEKNILTLSCQSDTFPSRSHRTSS